MIVHSITRITNPKVKIDKIFSSIKYNLSSCHVWSTARGKETKAQILCPDNHQISSPLHPWQISANRDSKLIVPTLAFPSLGKFVLSKAHFGTWEYHGSFVLFPAKQNDSITKIWKQLLWALNGRWQKPSGEERVLEVSPRLPGGLNEILYTKAPRKASGSQQTLDQ